MTSRELNATVARLSPMEKERLRDKMRVQASVSRFLGKRFNEPLLIQVLEKLEEEEYEVSSKR